MCGHRAVIIGIMSGRVVLTIFLTLVYSTISLRCYYYDYRTTRSGIIGTRECSNNTVFCSITIQQYSTAWKYYIMDCAETCTNKTFSKFGIMRETACCKQDRCLGHFGSKSPTLPDGVDFHRRLQSTTAIITTTLYTSTSTAVSTSVSSSPTASPALDLLYYIGREPGKSIVIAIIVVLGVLLILLIFGNVWITRKRIKQMKIERKIKRLRQQKQQQEYELRKESLVN